MSAKLAPKCPDCGQHVEFLDGLGRVVTIVDDGGPYEFNDDPNRIAPPPCPTCATPKALKAALSAA